MPRHVGTYWRRTKAPSRFKLCIKELLLSGILKGLRVPKRRSADCMLLN